MMEQTPIKVRYEGGAGGTTRFPVPFPVFDRRHLTLYLRRDESQTELTGGYEVTGLETGDPVVVLATPLPAGSSLTIVRRVAYDQPTRWPTGGNFSADVIEKTFDYLAMQTQQLAEENERALKVSESFQGKAPLLDDVLRDIDQSVQSAKNSAGEAQETLETMQAEAEEALGAMQSEAEQALETLRAMDAEAVTLPSGHEATAGFDHDAGKLVLGIPQGLPGPASHGGNDLWNEETYYSAPTLAFGTNGALYQSLLPSGPGTEAGARNPVTQPEFWEMYAPGMNCRRYDAAPADFNTYLTEGLYMIQGGSHANGPITTFGGFLRVSAYRDSTAKLHRVFQEYMVWQVNNPTAGKVFTRGYHTDAGLWTPWRSNAGVVYPEHIVAVTKPTKAAPFTLPKEGCMQGWALASAVPGNAVMYVWRNHLADWLPVGALTTDYPSHTWQCMVTTPVYPKGTHIACEGFFTWVHFCPVS